MKIRWVQFAVMAFAFTACTWAQDASGDRSCTDLSGKVRLPCPQEKQQDPAAKPVGQETIGRGQPESQPPILPVSVSAGNISSPTAAVDESAPAPATAKVSRGTQPNRSLERSFARNFVADQKGFWTSPLKLRLDDAQWLLPLAGAMTVVVLSDTDIERKLPTNASFIKRSQTFSDYGAVGYAGTVASAYLWSRATHNDHMREMAVLSGEAALNSLLITEGIKYIAGRNRPLENDGTGRFLNGGSSFPSGHSSTAWAIASVIAREYPGPLTQLLAYGGAAAISAARVTGRQHFTSDVLVGGAIGWFVGRQVYNAHHDRENPKAAYGIFERSNPADRHIDPAHLGSPYVPLDDWAYSALDRLAVWGFIHTAIAGQRPWTRLECARLIQEAGEGLSADQSPPVEANRLYQALQTEFADEIERRDGKRNVGIRLESIYARVSGISGPPLVDGYHFAQTIVNDYGRPYGGGLNAVSGLSADAVAGPFAFYLRGEYQHGATPPQYSSAVVAAIAAADSVPVSAISLARPANRVRLLDAYVTANIRGFQISFGNQSLWWGPGESGPMLFSTNAQPVTMIRLTRSEPSRLPGPLSWLGPVQTEFFWGRLSGQHAISVFEQDALGTLVRHQYTGNISQPYIHGEKFSFKPTPNLEFGFSSTAVFAGEATPLTWHTFLKSFSLSTTVVATNDPGDHRTGFDVRYAVPGLRKLLVIYTDSICEDEFSPIAYPRRCGWSPGVYLRRIPAIPRLDFRAEGIYTDLPNLNGTGVYYYNSHYNAGYTNQGNMLGNWIGREGRGLTLSSTYWLSPKDTIQVGYRHQHVNPDFIGGGQLTDFSARTRFSIRKDVGISAAVQFERWKFPTLAPLPQNNVTASFQITYWPKWKR
jgi:hypothetical protein